MISTNSYIYEYKGYKIGVTYGDFDEEALKATVEEIIALSEVLKKLGVDMFDTD